MRFTYLIFPLLLLLIATSGPAFGQDVRIMPCGDSITYDNHTADTRPEGERISYRYPLWQLLTNAGASFEFVGGVNAGYDIIPDPLDAHNEGWPGWTDTQIAANIYNWLVANPADIVLLHIGTNALDSSPDDVENILDEIDRYETDSGLPVHVVLARIINRSSYSLTTTQFNNNVEAMALARVGDAITMVDLEDGADINYALAGSGGDMIDNLHPTDDGYAKMANGWYAALQLLMPDASLNCPPGIDHYWMMEKEFTPYVNQFGTIARSTDPPSWTSGRVGYAQLFDYTNEVDIEDDGSLDWGSTDSFTMEFWMKKTNPVHGTTVNENEVILGRDDPATQQHWWLGVSAQTSPPGQICFRLHDNNANSSVIYSTTAVQDGVWHHIVAVRDNASGTNYLYIDGVLENSIAANYPAGFAANDVPMNIGWLNLSGGFHYDGILDEVAFYDRALTGPEVVNHFTAGAGGMGYCTGNETVPVIISTPVTSGVVDIAYAYDVNAGGNPSPAFSLLTYPAGMTIDSVTGVVDWVPTVAGDYDVNVEASNTMGTDTQFFTITVAETDFCPADISAYWKMNETSGSPFVDWVGDADAVCSACPNPVSGLIGGAQWFDGTDEVNAPASGIFDWAADASFTITYWMKTDQSTAGNRVLFGRDDGGSLHMWIGCDDNGTVRFQLREPGGDYVYLGGTGPVLNDNEWHFILAVRDNDLDRNAIYVDNVLIDETTHDYTVGFASTAMLNIGYLNLGGHYRYHGAMDDIAVYNKALTDLEMWQRFENGKANLDLCTAAAPAFISLPVLDANQGEPYSYNVGAVGNPGPAYSLTTAPAGMTIDPETGVIDWIPVDAGPTSVVVAAANSAGTTEQAFTVEVEEFLPFPDCMVSWWRLDETAGPPYRDLRAGFDALASNTPAPVSGILGGAQLFDGLTDEVDVADADQYDWAGDASFTIEFWMMTNQGGTTQVIVGRDGGDGNDTHWWIGTTSGNTVNFGLRDTAGQYVGTVSAATVVDGGWHHIVAVRDVALGQNQIWIDGVNEKSMPAVYAGNFACNANLNIGYLNLSSHYRYPGAVDEVAIYCRALGEAEILAHFNGGAGMEYSDPIAPIITTAPPLSATAGQAYTYDVESTGAPTAVYGLTTFPAGMDIDYLTGNITWMAGVPGDFDVTATATNSEGVDTQVFTITVSPEPVCPGDMISYWQLDETGGSTYFDSYASLHGSPSPTPPSPDPGGIVGGAQYFNGVNNYITVPDDVSLDWGPDYGFTIELWAKSTESTGNNQVMIGRDQAGGNPHWWLGVNNSGVPLWYMLDTNSNGVPTNGTETIWDGNWHHLVAVRDDNLNENRLYVDGVRVGISSHDYTAGFEATTTLGIGYMAYNGNPGYYYKGMLDEVALYTRALAIEDIQQNYQLGLAGRGYCEDNIAPASPTGFQLAYGHLGNTLDWDDNIESDLATYLVYREVTEGFTPGSGNLIAAVGTSQFFDPESGIGVSPYHVYYQIAARDLSGNVSAPTEPEEITGVNDPLLPSRFALHGNVPNPFNPMTTIKYELPVATRISLKIFDLSGRLVAVLKNNEMETAGRHEAVWRGRDHSGQPVAAGVYFYQMEGENFSRTRRMMLVK